MKDNKENKIIKIRGKKVILDRDAAELYGVDLQQLIKIVNKNKKRFPEDFMFKLTNDELEALNNYDFIRNIPYVFTEQGLAMLSTILPSKTASEESIRIVEEFTSMRKELGDEFEDIMQTESKSDNEFDLLDAILSAFRKNNVNK
jgi:ligand-binding sensor protein